MCKLRTFPAFQLRSLGILPFCANNTITAAVTFITTPGGDPKDFNSVKFDLFSVFKASYIKIYCFVNYNINIVNDVTIDDVTIDNSLTDNTSADDYFFIKT